MLQFPFHARGGNNGTESLSTQVKTLLTTNPNGLPGPGWLVSDKEIGADDLLAGGGKENQSPTTLTCRLRLSLICTRVQFSLQLTQPSISKIIFDLKCLKIRADKEQQAPQE